MRHSSSRVRPLPPTSTPTPFQPWGQVWEECGCFDSNYNSLQTSVTKHWSGGFFLLASYTFSKSIDYTSVSQFDWTSDGEPPRLTPASPRNVRAERGLSTFDVPHRFVTSFDWELPFFKNVSGVLQTELLRGWQVNGIFQLQSGRPFTVFDPSDPNLDGDTSDRPNLVGNPFPQGFTRTVQEDFNTAAFARIPQERISLGMQVAIFCAREALKRSTFLCSRYLTSPNHCNCSFEPKLSIS